MKKSQTSYHDGESLDVKKCLKSIGKEAFVRILFPILKKDPDITLEELAKKLPASTNINSLTIRLGQSRRIFDERAEYEALQIIVLSKRVPNEIKDEAQKLIDDFTFGLKRAQIQ
jgi:hypothetical protein